MEYIRLSLPTSRKFGYAQYCVALLHSFGDSKALERTLWQEYTSRVFQDLKAETQPGENGTAVFHLQNRKDMASFCHSFQFQLTSE